jgi:hypothetical protein
MFVVADAVVSTAGCSRESKVVNGEFIFVQPVHGALPQQVRAPVCPTTVTCPPDLLSLTRCEPAEGTTTREQAQDHHGNWRLGDVGCRISDSGRDSVRGPSAPPLIKACAKTKSGAIRVVSAKTKKCKTGEHLLVWNAAGVKGATGVAGAGGAAGASGKAGATGAAGTAGAAGRNGLEYYSGSVNFNVVSDNTWHNVASFQLTPGDWNMSYDLAESDYVDAATGTSVCKITIDGVVVPLSAPDSGFEQYLEEHRVVSSPPLVVSCRNHVADADGAPVTIPMYVYVSQDSANNQLVGTAL